MAVREGLLALLLEGERYGYQLKTAFEASTGGLWPLNVGQVYTTLDRLVRDGLVSVDDSREQKSYLLTADGREELTRWWQTSPADGPPPRDELLIKVLIAAAQGPERGLEVITRNRTALTGLLQARRQASRASTSAGGDAAEALSARLVEDALIARTEADLRWLDQCEARLLAVRAEADSHHHRSNP